MEEQIGAWRSNPTRTGSVSVDDECREASHPAAPDALEAPTFLVQWPLTVVPIPSLAG